ncbi:MAG TPA: hypothetical protein VMT81_00710 [Candidatus Paceibacterota bacterium]|nr:hypothetical protein [Candidatus Paceibacterota bacterium]
MLNEKELDSIRRAGGLVALSLDGIALILTGAEPTFTANGYRSPEEFCESLASAYEAYWMKAVDVARLVLVQVMVACRQDGEIDLAKFIDETNVQKLCLDRRRNPAYAMHQPEPVRPREFRLISLPPLSDPSVRAFLDYHQRR